jgi:hypothetical protein
MIFAKLAGFPYVSSTNYVIERSGGCTTFSCKTPPGNRPIKGASFDVWHSGTKIYTGEIVVANGSVNNGWLVEGRNRLLENNFFEADLPPLSEEKAWNIVKKQLQKYFPAGDFSFVASASELGGISLRGNFADGLRAFESACITPMAWGVDANNTPYVRNIGLGVSLAATPASTIQERQREIDNPRYILFNGGVGKFPPVFENTQFRNRGSHPGGVLFNELNRWSTLQTSGVYNESLSSGEDGSPRFAMASGASVQNMPNGKRAYELDNIGENISLFNANASFYQKAGQRYCLRFFTQGEPNVTATVILLEYEYTGVSTVSAAIFVDTSEEIERRFYFTAPVGVTTTRLKFTKTSGPNGANNGVYIYGITLFRDDEPYPEGWDIVAFDSSDAIVDYNFQDGAYLKSSLPLSPTGSRWVSLRRREASPVRASRRYKWSLELSFVTGEAWPQMQIIGEFFKSDGSFASMYQSPVINTVAPAQGVKIQISNNFRIPDNAATAVFSLRQLTNGAFKCHTFVVRDARESGFYGDEIEFLHDRGVATNRKGTLYLESEADDYPSALDVIAAWEATTQGVNPMSITMPLRLFPIDQSIRLVEKDERISIERMTVDLVQATVSLELSEKERTLQEVLAKRVKTSSTIN